MSAGATALVAGSGIDLLPLLDEVVEEIPFSRFAPVRGTRVPGHARCFVLGRAAGREVIVQRGRFHFYEGLAHSEVVAPVGWLRDLGAREIVFTNAVGGLASGLRPGGLVCVQTLHAWPCAHYSGPREAATGLRVPGCEAEGTYWWLHGPCYETHAEIAALRALGGTVVGMSTLPEVVHAHELGLRAAVVSCVTNLCGSGGPVTHEEVLRVSAEGSARLCRLLKRHLANHAQKK